MNLEEVNNTNNPLKLKSIAKKEGIDVTGLSTAEEIRGKILSSINGGELVETSDKIIFTYIGGGEDSPQVIKFMNSISFRRGEAVEIEKNEENELYIQKLSGNPCFINGSIDADEIVEMDKKARRVANEIRERTLKLDIEAKKARNKH